jgi:2-methylisocitrate lyase-like PEP mutase family enzyme
MTEQSERARRFLELHRPGQPLLMPNPWDAGSAKLLAWLGFEALATTSSGFAATLGRLDGSVTREEALAHCAAMVAAVDVPMSADLENGFADSAADVADTAHGAVTTGLAGFSIEDFAPGQDDPIYPLAVAAERVAAAAEVAHAGGAHIVLTARCENFLHGRRDLDDTIERLRAYQEAGADVLFSPGIATADEIRAVVSAVDRPVSVLPMPDTPPVADLAGLGVSRISVGGAFAFAALGGVVEAARELRESGTYGFRRQTAEGIRAVREAFT